MDENNYIKIIFFFGLLNIFKTMSRTCVNSKSKVETRPTPIPRRLLSFFNDHFNHLKYFLKLSPKTNINHKKIANHFKHAQKNNDLMFWRFIVGKWFQMVLRYFFWAINWQTYQLRNIQNFTSLYFVMLKLFFLFGWTLKSFVECRSCI